MHYIGILPFRAPLTGWAIRNHLTFKGKGQVLHLGWNNSMHQYGLSIKWMESRTWRFWWTSWTRACIMAKSRVTSTRETKAHWNKSSKDTLRWLKDWNTFQTRKGLVSSYCLVWRKENRGVGNEQEQRLRQIRQLPVTFRNRTKRYWTRTETQETPPKHENKFISFFMWR